MRKSSASYKALSLWRLRLLIAALIPSFIALLRPDSIICRIIAVVAGTAALLTALIYLPLFYWRFGYSLQKDYLTVNSGVIFCQTRTIHLQNIQYVTLVQTPLQTVFRLATVSVTAAGGKLLLFSLELADAHRLKAVLTLSQPD